MRLFSLAFEEMTPARVRKGNARAYTAKRAGAFASLPLDDRRGANRPDYWGKRPEQGFSRPGRAGGRILA